MRETSFVWHLMWEGTPRTLCLSMSKVTMESSEWYDRFNDSFRDPHRKNFWWYWMKWYLITILKLLEWITVIVLYLLTLNHCHCVLYAEIEIQHCVMFADIESLSLCCIRWQFPRGTLFTERRTVTQTSQWWREGASSCPAVLRGTHAPPSPGSRMRAPSRWRTTTTLSVRTGAWRSSVLTPRTRPPTGVPPATKQGT